MTLLVCFISLITKLVKITERFVSNDKEKWNNTKKTSTAVISLQVRVYFLKVARDVFIMDRER